MRDTAQPSVVRRQEAVVDRAADDVVVEPAGVGRTDQERRVVVLERDVQVLDARAPLRRDRVVDTDAERPAEDRAAGADAAECDAAAAVSESAGEVRQPAIPDRDADAAAEGAEPVEVLGAGNAGERERVVLSGILQVGLETEHDLVHLPVVAKLAAEHDAADIAADAAAEIETGVPAAPVEGQRGRRSHRGHPRRRNVSRCGGKGRQAKRHKTDCRNQKTLHGAPQLTPPTGRDPDKLSPILTRDAAAMSLKNATRA